MEFEEKNFRVKSDGWEEKVSYVGHKRYLESPQKDMWEFLEGKLKGEQLFSWEAAMRETAKVGKKMPTVEELKKLFKTREDMPNLVFAGRHNSHGFNAGRGFDAVYHSKVDAYFWSCSVIDYKTAWSCFIHSDENSLYYEPNIIGYDDGLDTSRLSGLSVRCIKKE